MSICKVTIKDSMTIEKVKSGAELTKLKKRIIVHELSSTVLE